MHQGVFTVSVKEEKRAAVLGKFVSGHLSRENAAKLLGLSERQVSRLAKEYREHGLRGIVHKSRGRPAHNRSNEIQSDEIKRLLEKKYFDTNMTHTKELLEANEGIHVSYSTLRRICHETGYVKRKKAYRRRGHKARPRAAEEGLLVQMDGSHHKWNGVDEWVLIATIDDATSEIVSAHFSLAETTLACLHVMHDLVLQKGVPVTLYTDRAGIFGGNKRTDFSQFGTACAELGCHVLFAHSAQAKGRIERAWNTFQDRLIPELRLAGITTLKQANEYVKNVFLPTYWNSQNKVPAPTPKSAYQKVPSHINLTETLTVRESRKVTSDSSFSWRGKKYVVTSKSLSGWSGATIEIRIYPDGLWSAFYGGRRLKVKELSWGRRHHSQPVDYRRAS